MFFAFALLIPLKQGPHFNILIELLFLICLAVVALLIRSIYISGFCWNSLYQIGQPCAFPGPFWLTKFTTALPTIDNEKLTPPSFSATTILYGYWFYNSVLKLHIHLIFTLHLQIHFNFLLILVTLTSNWNGFITKHKT